MRENLILGLLSGLFFVGVYFIGFFQTVIHTMIIVAITLIILKLKGEI